VGSNVIFTLTASNAGPRSHRHQCNGCYQQVIRLLVTLLQVQEHIQAEQAFGQGYPSNGASATLTITATVNATVVMPQLLLQPMKPIQLH
jgi:hypothetical protein